jgi:hypothetical protein
MQRRIAAMTGLIAALALAGPASANTIERFPFQEEFVDTASCGVVLTTQISGDVASHFGNDGTWRFTQVKIRYAGVALDTATGATLELPARQNILDSGDVVATSGQGIFIRLAGEGVLLHDNGHLLFNPGDGSTIMASAKVVPFDDPTLAARIDEALCSLFD